MVEDMIFRKEDFGIKDYRDEIDEKKKMKKKICKHFLKYSLIKESL